jgi:AcrR family transcriptional regulator
VPLDRIIATAIAIVDEQGADMLTMRTLAQRLDSGTATLYRHFTSRAQLIAHVVDAVLGEMAVDAVDVQKLPWRQACELTAYRMFNFFRARPNLAPLLAEQVPVGPNAMVQRELMIGVFLDAGFAPSLAAKVHATSARFVLGFAMQLGEPSIDEAEHPRAWPAPDAQSFPVTASVVDHLPVPLDEEFAFGLELLLNGLEQLLDRC